MRKIFPCTIRAGVSLCALIALESFNLLTAQVADPDQIDPSPQSVLQQTNTLPGEDGASSALYFSNFNLGTDDLGVFQNSVNLFTGEVALPVNIAALPAVRGLSASVSAKYSSANSSYLTGTWNLEAPTGILGMGWGLDYPKIIVDNKTTGTREDDEFYLLEGGSSTQLVRTGGSTSIKEYEPLNYQFWKVRYYTTSEKWEIIKEDGSRFIYGDKDSGRSTIQWIVKWSNWIGSSSQVSGQQQQAAIWNLSEITNIYGDAIQYKYSNVEQYVGSSAGKKYTEASYLSEIIDPLGRKIVFSYGNKTAAEYQDPHTEKPEPDAYQERYEKLYLKEVQVKDSENKVIGSVNFDFEIKGVGDLSKRYLTAIHKKLDEGLKESSTTSYS